MPIVHIASRREDVPLDAVNVRDASEQWKNHSASPETFSLWLYDTHVGLCVREYERNGYDDSDFFMVVYNPIGDKFEHHEFASTRGWSYPCFASHVDAMPEILAKYEAYLIEQKRLAEEQRQRILAATPAKGKVLRVVRGRKVPVGTVGVCVWLGSSAYGKRVGIKDDQGKIHWTAYDNVEVSAVPQTSESA
jgi:hypothetical protein